MSAHLPLLSATGVRIAAARETRAKPQFREDRLTADAARDLHTASMTR
jgi:hypothetical protein